MKYLSTSTTSISIVIAVLLFAVASLFEGDPPAPELVPEEKTPRMITTVREDSALRDENAAEACRAAEEQLLQTVAESQACDIDADCTILDYGYPLQCMTSIAQSAVSAFRLEYRDYEALCEYRVYYDCPSEPLVRVPVCRNNRCAVELSRNEILKQLTMDHIGQ
ncbi:MAG: hypothetical protein R3315_09455 [Woeseiaceae bacterium]|nr:hypothetical protein [Woeseiaceae bacterium]